MLLVQERSILSAPPTPFYSERICRPYEALGARSVPCFAVIGGTDTQMTQLVERSTSDTAAGLLRALEECALPWSGAPSDLDPLLELAQGATVVLIGEATHGTHEFYRIRAELTQRLIREQGFCVVAAEAE